MWQRFGSDPEDAAPAAVLRALHRRGVGTLLQVTTSPSHVALTVAAERRPVHARVHHDTRRAAARRRRGRSDRFV